jgi:hypothetical protein
MVMLLKPDLQGPGSSRTQILSDPSWSVGPSGSAEDGAELHIWVSLLAPGDQWVQYYNYIIYKSAIHRFILFTILRATRANLRRQSLPPSQISTRYE